MNLRPREGSRGRKEDALALNSKHVFVVINTTLFAINTAPTAILGPRLRSTDRQRIVSRLSTGRGFRSGALPSAAWSAQRAAWRRARETIEVRAFDSTYDLFDLIVVLSAFFLTFWLSSKVPVFLISWNYWYNIIATNYALYVIY